jgi:hypothetical protein
MNLEKFLLFFICYFVLSGNILSSERTLVVGICGRKPDTESILSCKTGAERIVAGTVFNSLFRYSPESPNSVEPELAENIPKPRISDGRQYWTITIKKNVKFHRLPGGQEYELEADDVAYSLELLSGSDDSRLLSGIRTRIESDNRITLILEKPLSPNLFLAKLTGFNRFYIFSKKAFEDKGLFSGTGAFMFVPGTGEDSLYLPANKSCFKGKPDIVGVRFVFGSDAIKMEQELLRGDLDVLIPPGKFSDTINARGSDNFKRLYFCNGRSVYLGFNIEDGPFNDKGLRKTTAESIERDALCSQMNGCERLYGLTPQITPASLSREDIIRFGLDYGNNNVSSERLLVKEGVSIDLCTSSRDVPDIIIYSIRDSSIKTGINLLTDDSKGGIKICRDDAYDLKLLSFDAAGNVHTLLSILMAENVIDKKYEYMIEASGKITSNTRQADLLKHIQIKILADINILPLVFIREYALSKKDIDPGYDCSSQPFFIVTEKTRFADSGNQ